jgi:apolipoprotein N-acyltransferase
VNGWQKALRLWPWLAAIASGLLCTACFAPVNQSWLCWIALTPLIAAIWFSGENSRRKWLRDLLLGYVAGIVFFTGAFSWLGALGSLFENLFLHGLSLLLSIYLGLNFAFWSWLVGLIRPVEAPLSGVSAANERQKTKWDEMLSRAGESAAAAPSSPWLRSTTNLRLAFCLACAWVTHEWIRSWLFSGFGWNGLGIALHANWPVIQIAEFTGVAGLSFAIAFANVIAVTTTRRLILEARIHRMRPHYDLTLTMAAIVGLLAFGMHVSQFKSPAKSVRVAAVQANIAQRQKFDPQFTNKIFDRFTHLSEIALRTNPPPELLIWPESSTPGPVLEDEESYRFVMDFAASAKTDLLLGTIDVDEGHAYNAAFLISQGGEKVQVYRKIHLVPFGEYIPLRRSFSIFAMVASRWVPGDFTAGREFSILKTSSGTAKIAALICFEDTVGDLTRKFVLQGGANLLVNITNDGWFLHSAGSQQHLANAVFRCVETRRPMVRAANTGVTCFVNEFGRVTQTLQDETGSTFTEGVLTGDVDLPIEHTLTFYTRHGELFAKFCACVTLLAFVGIFFLRRIGQW